MGDPFDRLLKTVTLKSPTEDLGIDSSDSAGAQAFCPLLHADNEGDEWRVGRCSQPRCQDCAHLAYRLNFPSTWPDWPPFDRLRKIRPIDYSVGWVCSDCSNELPRARWPGFYSDGLCDRCGEYSIVLQVVLVPLP